MLPIPSQSTPLRIWHHGKRTSKKSALYVWRKSGFKLPATKTFSLTHGDCGVGASPLDHVSKEIHFVISFDTEDHLPSYDS